MKIKRQKKKSESHGLEIFIKKDEDKKKKEKKQTTWVHDIFKEG